MDCSDKAIPLGLCPLISHVKEEMFSKVTIQRSELKVGNTKSSKKLVHYEGGKKKTQTTNPQTPNKKQTKKQKPNHPMPTKLKR